MRPTAAAQRSSSALNPTRFKDHPDMLMEMVTAMMLSSTPVAESWSLNDLRQNYADGAVSLSFDIGYQGSTARPSPPIDACVTFLSESGQIGATVEFLNLSADRRQVVTAVLATESWRQVNRVVVALVKGGCAGTGVAAAMLEVVR